MNGDAPTRRSFLGRLLGGTLLAGLGGFIAGIVGYLVPSVEVSSALGPRRFRVGKIKDVKIGDGQLVLVEGEPVWVVHLPKGFVAMSAICTHKGCLVDWNGKGRVFACPCHNGSFDERGNVLSGLPLRPLRPFHVGAVKDEVYVSREELHRA